MYSHGVVVAWNRPEYVRMREGWCDWCTLARTLPEQSTCATRLTDDRNTGLHAFGAEPIELA
jgi:hypothetical protein